MILHLFRCQCGWEETDHEKEDNEDKPWKLDDVILDKTNAYGEISFQGAGKSTRAKVTM